MHPNSIFRRTSDDRALDLIRSRGFGQVTVVVDGTMHAAHVPLLLSEDAQSLDIHLVRSNPIARGLSEPLDALITINGPDGYVSPDWYGAADQVPTWNYVAIQLRGSLYRLDQE